MSSVRSAIENTIPITQFNRGMAGKIFENVKKNGAKVVMKNNTAECVLLSPEEYVKLLDALEDAQLMAMAMERKAKHEAGDSILFEELENKLGLSRDDCDDFMDVEFE